MQWSSHGHGLRWRLGVKPAHRRAPLACLHGRVHAGLGRAPWLDLGPQASSLVTHSLWGTDKYTETGSATWWDHWECLQVEGEGWSQGGLSTEQRLNKCSVQPCPPLLQRASRKCKVTSGDLLPEETLGQQPPQPWGNTRATCCEQASRHSRALETQKAFVAREDFVCPFWSGYKIEGACLGLFYSPQKLWGENSCESPDPIQRMANA